MGGAGVGQERLAAVLALGDNFYNDGVGSTSDTLWTTMYKNVYLEPNKGRHLPRSSVRPPHDALS